MVEAKEVRKGATRSSDERGEMVKKLPASFSGRVFGKQQQPREDWDIKEPIGSSLVYPLGPARPQRKMLAGRRQMRSSCLYLNPVVWKLEDLVQGHT